MARNIITVRQQVKNLLASVRSKEDLLRKQDDSRQSDDLNDLENDESSKFVEQEYTRGRDRSIDVESIEIANNHKDFESLLNERLLEEPPGITSPKETNVIKKKPFLKKGEGIARFRMKPRKPKTKSKNGNSNADRKFPDLEDGRTNLVHQVRSAPLIAFEKLEQKLDDSSFCSTSSVISKLMEDSMKSTPIKSKESTEVLFREDKLGCNLFGSDRDTLGVIDEEPQDDDDGEESLKSLLQTRLLELEAEMHTFKTESSHLSRVRGDYEKEYNRFCKERIVLLEKIRAEYLSGTKEIEEEKGKLQCEKRAFEKYMKEERNRPNKEEKEEIRLLKEEIKLMKEEMNRKESRWAAAQARTRTEMKLLKDHNATLQKEVNDLKKAKKKVMFAPVLKNSKSCSNVSGESKVVLPQNSQLESVSNSSIPDSGVFTENSRLSNESFESVHRNANKLLDTDTASDAVLVPELSAVEVSEFMDSNGNCEKVYSDGRKEIWCTNGSVKKISPDGKITKTIFYNGDVEEVNVVENVVKYYHAGSSIWHSKFGDGLEIKEFPDGQVEKYYEDGSAEIFSPDGTILTVSSLGEKKWKLKDGSVITINEKRNEKRIVFPNGQIEVHVPEFKRREYPDGTVKTIYSNSGMQETKYSNGRIRLKTQDGTLISDTKIR